MTDTDVVTGAEVRRRRVDLGLSRQTLAYEVPCSMSHLATLEQGMRPIRSEVMARAAAALDRLEAAAEEGIATAG